MKKLEELIDKHYRKILLLLSLIILVNTCGNPNKTVNKKIESLTGKIDSLETIIVTKEDLTVEGLKSEKRMIQSTDRKIFDVNRQTEIDKEIQSLGL